MARAAYKALGFCQHPFHVAAVGIVARQTFSTRERFMVRTARLRFHHLSVTGGAQLGSGGPEQFGLSRTVTMVAGGAVTVQDGLVCDFFQKLRLGVGVAGKAELVTAVFGNGREIGPVRVVARQAFTTLEGVVNRLAFQGVHGLGMTAGTEIGSLFINQSLELSRVWLVAREAPLAGIHRRMLEGHHQFTFLVAPCAELVAVFRE